MAPHRSFITVVSGLPRSGTSVTMQMIHSGGIAALTDEIRAADTDNPKGYFEFERVKQLKTDKAWLPDAVGKCVKLVHLLLLDLPPEHEYRVVFTKRALEEVIKSQQVMLDRQGKKGAALPPQALMKMYQQQLAQVKAHMAAHPAHFKLLEVDYNQMVSAPAAAAASINAFLGGDLDERAMAAAVDPSLYRNRGS